MIYGLLAPFYDEFNGDIDYSCWSDFIVDCNKRFGRASGNLGLDLGCGTGSMTLELASRGFDMTGVDYSPEMLDIARGRAEGLGLNEKILWLCQDMTEFELYGTVDIVTCCLDGINHLTDRVALDKCFYLVHNYLVPEGLFIFDINGKGKFENIYSDLTYAMENGDAVCIWQNYYNEKSHLCDFYITLFERELDGRYVRYDEAQRERMYTLRSVKNALKKAGFDFIGAFSDFNYSEATDESERIYIVARCKKTA